jgi:Protein of unknown function (DUF1800)
MGEATSASGNFRIGVTDASLFQTPMRAPTVFNYFRPGYVPPNSEVANRGLVAPEFQIAHEVSVATYANTMQNWVPRGLGTAAMGATGPDVVPQYTQARALAADSEKLVDHINLMLTGNSLAPETRAAILAAVNGIAPTANNSSVNRTHLAVFMTMLAPDYLVQR